MTALIRSTLRAVAVALLLSSLPACDIDLSGTWDLQPVLAGAGEAPSASGWVAQSIPAVPLSGPQDIKGPDQEGFWLRHRFDLAPDRAAGDAALVWESIGWGFRAWVNGVELGRVELTSPGSLPMPPGILRPAGNELLLEVRGWKRLPHGENGEILFPIGSARFGWGSRNAWVQGTIGLDCYRGTRLRAVLLDGDPTTRRVSAVARCDGAPPAGARVELEVRDDAGATLGTAVGPAEAPVVAVCTDLPAWSPDQPRLCRALVVLRAADGAELDRREERFGARVITVDGRLRLDGHPLTLLGSNLVNEFRRMDPEALRRYAVDQARAMNVRGFRTHTMPPTQALAEICDAGGQWLLAEMPTTYNGVPTGLDEAGERTWRANAEAQASAWCESLHNHPSIVAWVAVNEPPMEAPFGLQDWIHHQLIPHLRAVSPGRPVMSAWGSTDEVDDVHIYAGYWNGAEGDFREVAERHAAGLRPGQILANTEYIEGFTGDRPYRWTGQADRASDVARMRYAAIGAMQTETLRALDYGLILPYQFSTWSHADGWRPDAPTPMFAALRSALSPVAVAWEPIDRDCRAGGTLEATVVVCNDTTGPAAGTLEIRLMAKDPGWRVEELDGEVVAKLAVAVPAGARQRLPVRLALPDEEASRVLVARLGGSISERPLRLLRPSPPPLRRVRVVGAPAEAVAGLRRLGIDAIAGLDPARNTVDADVVLVWEEAVLEASTQYSAGQLNAWLGQGGHLVVMRQRAWPDTGVWSMFPRLPGGACLSFTTERDETSTLWRATDDRLWQGLLPQHGDGWNGLRGAITRDAIVAPWSPDGTPALQNASGWIPSDPAAVVVEGEGSAAWPIDHADARFVVDGRPRPFSHTRGGALLLCTKTAPPDGAYVARRSFTSAALSARVQAFEHGRKGSSPFRWRIDHGPWTAVAADAPCHGLARVSQEANVWFGWSELGSTELAAGSHELELAVDQPMADGTYLLALDAVLLAPRIESRVLAWSGGHRPAIIEVACGKGRVTFAQPLFATRLDPGSPDHDPAAARLFCNLVSR